MNLKQGWFRIVVGCLWIVALVALAPGVHAVSGGDGPSDVCRQQGSAVACGQSSSADGFSTALGRSAGADGNSNVAIGALARAEGGEGENVAIGGPAILGGLISTTAEGGGAVSIGAGTEASGTGSIAIGRHAEARATATGSVAIGQNTSARGQNSVVLGESSTDNGRANVVSFGGVDSHRDLIHVRDIESTGDVEANSFLARGEMNVGSAIVRSGLTVNTGGASIVGGIDANNAIIEGVASGEISASSTDAVNGSQLYETNQNVQAAQADALAALAGLEQMVNQLLQTGICNVTGGTVDCSNSLELAGGKVGAGASNAIAVGSGANAQSSGGIAVGHNATAVESNSVAIGAGAVALSSVAVGTGAQATGASSTAIGDDSVASGDYASAFGNEAQATHDNSVAIGNGSTTSAANTVSVGSTGSERRITHVAPGVSGTDAVNMDQLNAAIAGMGGTSQRYIDERIDSLRVETARGIAAVAAMVNVQPSTVGKTALGVGVGNYDGQTAFGLSLARAPQEGVLLSFGAAAPVGGSPVLKGGLSLEF